MAFLPIDHNIILSIYNLRKDPWMWNYIVILIFGVFMHLSVNIYMRLAYFEDFLCT